MYAFIRPSKIKNAALTEVPMIPPTVLKLSKRSETAAAVAATTTDVMITILNWVRFDLTFDGGDCAHVEWPSEKNVPTVTGFCPVARSLLVIRSIAYK